MSLTITCPLPEGSSFESRSRFGENPKLCFESVVFGTKRFGRIAVKDCFLISDDANLRPTATPSARSSALIRRAP